MNVKDIIDEVKMPAENSMIAHNVLASFLILKSIESLKNQPYIAHNNPLLFRNKDTGDLYFFDSIEDCFSHYINITEDIKGDYDIMSVLKKSGMYNKYYVGLYIEYNLRGADRNCILRQYPQDKSVIELSGRDPLFDIYKVRLSIDSEEVKYVSNNKYDAVNECKKYPGYKVYKSRSKIVKSNEHNEKPNQKQKLILHTGDAIKLNKVNIYKDPYDTKPSRCVTGIYYVYSPIKTNGRFPITNKKEYAGDEDFYIVGWIK